MKSTETARVALPSLSHRPTPPSSSVDEDQPPVTVNQVEESIQDAISEARISHLPGVWSEVEEVGGTLAFVGASLVSSSETPSDYLRRRGRDGLPL